MPVAVVLEFEGGTPAQYDEIVKMMSCTPGGKGAPGGLFHWVTETDGGMRVTDVWHSRAQFEHFAQEQIGSYSQRVGAPAPTITFYDVHNYLAAG